jgi:hypothetical protein
MLLFDLFDGIFKFLNHFLLMLKFIDHNRHFLFLSFDIFIFTIYPVEFLLQDKGFTHDVPQFLYLNLQVIIGLFLNFEKLFVFLTFTSTLFL